VNPHFTIVIPVLNLSTSIDVLLRCLESLDFPRDRFACIIVDDGSTDGTRDILKSYQSSLDLTVLFHRVNQGRSQARNTGWKQARGEVVLFLDGDMLPEPELLKDYDQAMARHMDWDVISGGRYCITVANDADLRRSLARLIDIEPEELFTNDISAQFKAIYKKAVLGQYPSPLLNKLELQLREVCRLYPESMLCGYSLVTSNVAIRRQRLEETGGFDPFLRRSEDTELGLRLWESGSRFGFADGARAYHLYDARQPDRHMTLAEHLAFFYRHPYSLVLLVHLWCLLNATGGAKQGPLAGDLGQLAQKGQDPIRTGLAQPVAGLLSQLNLNSYSYPREFIVDYFAETSGSSSAQIEQYLDLALKRGLFTTERDGTLYFDIYHTSNWLRYHSGYEEYCLRFSSYGRTNKTRYQLTRSREDIAHVEYAGTYELDIPTEILESAGEGTLNLALPTEGKHQSDVKITDCFPDDLLQYADYSRGLIVGFPLHRCCAGARKIGYAFQCNVREVTTAQTPDDAEHFANLSHYLQPAFNAEYLAKARRLLARIDLESEADAYVNARAIYLWILNNTSFYETPLPDFYCLDTGFGSCVHQASLFVNLCRLANLPARERCGGILSKAPSSERTVIETCTRGFSPFTHTWTEFHTAQYGWVPVDFIGWGYGGRLMKAHNITDERLRAELKKDTALYDDYYFGSLDPFRIHTGEAVNKTPLYCFELGNRKKPTAAWHQQLLAKTRHALRCEVVAANAQLTSAAPSLINFGTTA
jgi:glycosyltransferase involved in cell wall biosynthesis/transglutaminase-like putative cysteine protease